MNTAIAVVIALTAATWAGIRWSEARHKLDTDLASLLLTVRTTDEDKQ